MNIVGYILIIFGGFWSLSRLLNQSIMFRIIRDKMRDSGFLYGIWCYLRGEVFGLGLGISLIVLGFYLIN